MPNLENIINRKSEHIIVWRDAEGIWRTEQYGKNWLCIHGDITDALIHGQVAKDADPLNEYFLVEVKFVHNFRATSSVL
jgi:hypothetical protein